MGIKIVAKVAFALQLHFVKIKQNKEMEKEAIKNQEHCEREKNRQIQYHSK